MSNNRKSSKPRKRRSVSASTEGIVKLRKAIALKKDSNNVPLTQEALAEKLSLSNKTIQRFLSEKPIDWSNALRIINELNLKEEEILFSEDSLVYKTIENIENESLPNSDRAIKLIEELENSFTRLKVSRVANSQIREWIKNNRRTLSQKAAEYAFQECFVSNNYNLNEDYTEEIDKFSKEIRVYLKFIYNCLKIARWKFLHKAMLEFSFPKSREPKFYIEALKFIRDQEIGKNFSLEESKDLVLSLEYLIETIRITL
jgi:transcriptional regulator with XRE-family HTH domain